MPTRPGMALVKTKNLRFTFFFVQYNLAALRKHESSKKSLHIVYLTYLVCSISIAIFPIKSIKSF
jgi:hypothetical protein